VAIHYFTGARRPASHSAKRLSTPPSKSRKHSCLTEGIKEAFCTTTRTLQGVAFTGYPCLRKTAGTPGENTQNPTTGTQGIKTLTNNNIRCVNINAN
jgi:hypothetical protein